MPPPSPSPPTATYVDLSPYLLNLYENCSDEEIGNSACPPSSTYPVVVGGVEALTAEQSRYLESTEFTDDRDKIALVNFLHRRRAAAQRDEEGQGGGGDVKMSTDIVVNVGGRDYRVKYIEAVGVVAFCVFVAAAAVWALVRC